MDETVEYLGTLKKDFEHTAPDGITHYWDIGETVIVTDAVKATGRYRIMKLNNRRVNVITWNLDYFQYYRPIWLEIKVK